MNLYWCIIIAQSPFYSLRFTLNALHSMYIFNNCMMVCVLQNSFTPLNVLSHLPTDPSLSPCCGQSLSLVQLFATVWTAPCQSSLSFTISWNLLKFMSIQSVMPSNHLVLSYPLLLLPSIFHSIRVISKESALCIRWPKYWSFSFSISHSNECSRLISFGIGWFDILAVQGTLRSLLQHHNLKASVLWR